jgi:hypothetical protein
MKTFYAKSVLEGAPIGNKNAAGPHKMGKQWGVRVSTNRSSRPDEERWPMNVQATFFHQGGQTHYATSGGKNQYNAKMTPSSAHRLLKVIAKGKLSTYNNGIVRGLSVSKKYKTQRSEGEGRVTTARLGKIGDKDVRIQKTYGPITHSSQKRAVRWAKKNPDQSFIG